VNAGPGKKIFVLGRTLDVAFAYTETMVYPDGKNAVKRGMEYTAMLILTILKQNPPPRPSDTERPGVNAV
jgi:hypothetical protein